MKNIVIKNEKITVEISRLGAELESIKSQSGKELLWQGDAEVWSGRSPNLFPFIGRLFEQRYTHKGVSYPMAAHGFTKVSVFDIKEQSETSVDLHICDSEETRKIYPFSFEFSIGYRLVGEKLSIVYSVYNSGDEQMYFGVGGHPGFNVPLNNTLAFSDYYLEMQGDNVMRVATTDNKLVGGEDKIYPELKNGRINLRHDLFDEDAFILYNTPGKVTLKSDKDDDYIVAEYPDMKYCAFWHTVGKEAPFICIEPWTGIPGRDNTVEELSQMPGMISLQSSGKKEFIINYSFFVR